MKNWKYAVASVSSTFSLWFLRQELTDHPQNTISQNILNEFILRGKKIKSNFRSGTKFLQDLWSFLLTLNEQLH